MKKLTFIHFNQFQPFELIKWRLICMHAQSCFVISFQMNKSNHITPLSPIGIQSHQDQWTTYFLFVHFILDRASINCWRYQISLSSWVYVNYISSLGTKGISTMLILILNWILSPVIKQDFLRVIFRIWHWLIHWTLFMLWDLIHSLLKVSAN